MQCSRSGCGLRDEPQSFYAHARDRDTLKCPGCGGALETHPAQYGTVAVQRDWERSKSDRNGMSLDISFGATPDFASIKRDCPSMELKRDKHGWYRPVSKNDVHDRRWKKEAAAATERYQAQEKVEKGMEVKK